MKDKTHNCSHCGATNSHFSFQCSKIRKPIKKKEPTKIGNYTMYKPVQGTKKPKEIPKVSKKQLDRLKAYKKVRDAYMEKHEYCEARIPNVCTGLSKDLHHKCGRIGDLLTNTDYFMALCSECHAYSELHPTFAKENGFSLNRLDK